MQTVHFLSLRNGSLQCRETGTSYAVEFVRGIRAGFVAMRDGEPLALEASRADALRHIEADARIEFLSRQADCGAYSA